MAESRLSGKLAVILHADVAGSTALVKQDEQIAHKRIQETFRSFGETITKYQGHVRELRGDALLAEFERASDAVTAALVFQAEQLDYLAQLNDSIQPIVRVGIAMGEVIIADSTITGEGVVLAQRLEQLAEPGAVVIQGAAYETIPSRFQFEYGDLGEHEVKGFDKPVRVYSVSLKPDTDIPQPSPLVHRTRNTVIVFVSVAIIIMGIALLWFKPWEGIALLWFKPWEIRVEPASVERMAFPLPGKPSIAVLPFANISGDPKQVYLSDGISRHIITDLSKIRGLTVIARNSSFGFRDSKATAQEIGESLGAQFILDGSVQKSDDRLRITSQLVDSKTGHQLWAERFDRRLPDVFLLQDEITREIISALAVRLSADEQEHLSGNVPTSFEAYDLFLRGQQASVDFSEEAITEAIELYRQAIRLDPNYAHAYGALAVARIRQFFLGFADTPARTRDRALELARKAATMDPGSHQIQWSLGYIHMYRKEFNEALEAAERAVSLSPNYADGYALLALVKNNLGQADDVIPLIEKAMLLNPHYTWDYIYQLGLRNG